ncbi:phosphate ABC transporter permease subunit PstC [candidate division KSB1 bacterium]|nr:phosphate ABC transporter permease subunit PstC [candidate division KSB1 bacterium]
MQYFNEKKYFWEKIKEKSIENFFLFNGLFAIFILIGIFVLLFVESIPALKEVSILDFLTKVNWDPTSPEKAEYGMLAMIASTFLATVGSMILAVPIGIASAAYIAEIANHRTREIIKPTIEILAGIPSVVIGFLGIVVLGPMLAKLFGTSNGLNALNGSILLAIMSLPTIISISEDAIMSVPQDYKNASLALGASRWETLVRVTLPAASSGIFAAVMLGMGRAVGETMTVLMATGNAPAMPHSLTDPVRTMTATIAIELGETVQGSVHYHSLFVIGVILFFISFLVNLVSDIVLNRYQKVNK